MFSIIMMEPPLTREVVVAVGVHARHLRRLATDERAARLPAALRDAADDVRRLRHVELASGVVVQEDERLSALQAAISGSTSIMIMQDGAGGEVQPPGGLPSSS